MSTPIGAMKQKKAMKTGMMYIIIFCCWTIGLSGALFFRIICRCVMNWVATYTIVMTMITVLTVLALEPASWAAVALKWAEIGAPKMWACRALITSAGVMKKRLAPFATLYSSR